MIERPLTTAEIALTQAMFGYAIDTGKVRVRQARWWPFQPRDVLMAPDGDFWCPPEGRLYRDCFASAERAMQALFVHEMTHVWQAQRGGRWYLPLMRHPLCRYTYDVEPGRRFAAYGIEQQAEIMADAYRLRRGSGLPGKPDLDVYTALIPFAMGPL